MGGHRQEDPGWTATLLLSNIPGWDLFQAATDDYQGKGLNNPEGQRAVDIAFGAIGFVLDLFGAYQGVRKGGPKTKTGDAEASSPARKQGDAEGDGETGSPPPSKGDAEAEGSGQPKKESPEDAERRKKQEAEDQARRDEEKRRRDEEAEAKRKDEEAEAERQRQEKEEAERRRKEQEETAQRKEDEAAEQKAKKDDETKEEDQAPGPEQELPKSWDKFSRTHDDSFKQRLKSFRGNDSLEAPSGLRGGEGQLFPSDKQPGQALKRWFEKRIPDMPKSVKLLEDAATGVARDPALSQHVEVVKIHDKGPDWVLRDFDEDSVARYDQKLWIGSSGGDMKKAAYPAS